MLPVDHIEVWRDKTSDPNNPVWCVSLCADDGEEIRCIYTFDDKAEAIEVGGVEATERNIPLEARG